jgi:hypothetical protein
MFEARDTAWENVAAKARLVLSRAVKAAQLAAQPPRESLNLQASNRPERQRKALLRHISDVLDPQDQDDKVEDAVSKSARGRQRRKRRHVVHVSQGNDEASKISNPLCSFKKHGGGHPNDLHKCEGQVTEDLVSSDDNDDIIVTGPLVHTVPKRMKLPECSSGVLMPLADAEDFLARFLHV